MSMPEDQNSISGWPSGINPVPYLDRLTIDFFERNQLESMFFLLNAVTDGILCIDREGRIVYSNPAARNLLGYSQFELRSASVAELLEDANAWALLLQQVMSGEIVATDRHQMTHKNGIPIHIVITAVPVKHNQETENALIVFRDTMPGVLASLSLTEREKLLQGIFELLPSGVILLNHQGRVLRLNGTARKILQLDHQDIRGHALEADRWKAQRVDGSSVALEESPFLLSLHDNQIHKEMLYLESVQRYMLVNAQPLQIRSAGRTSQLVIATFTDINEQYRGHQRMQGAIELNNEINRLLTDLLTERGAKETIQTALSGVSELTDADFATIGTFDMDTNTVLFDNFFSTEDPAMQPESFRVPLEDLPCSPDPDKAGMLQPGSYDHEDGPWMPEFMRTGLRTFLCAPIYSEDALLGVVYLFRRVPAPFTQEDIANMHNLTPVLSAAISKSGYEKKLNELATTDPLTGLANRRTFFTELEAEMERSRRYATPISLLMLDLDHFKLINDRFGHLAGDEVLCEVARIMRERTRKTDVVARTGGEEFMILLPESRLAGAIRTAQKLRQSIEELIVQYYDQSVQVTVSIGAAELGATETLHEFYARLDGLLYRSKNSGRNQISHEE
ncbi:MAG: diguanylate cyclase [Leptospiraceae bacterium]|nr:diguanylate cyclase [Leptospiraceae bacterium]